MITDTKRNQTEERWTAPHILGTNGFDKGVGVFAVADPESDEPDALKKIVIEDLSYQDCLTRGENCIAFKWLPNKVVAVVGGASGLTSMCDGLPCSGSCLGNSTCMCVRGICR
ncbi:MAG: hypothetical protein E7G42_01020 [Serratia marcescens]|uniref:hypothetical protein n=1 Tax=Pantoea eucrina TaxID=472693 RepID=UPI0024B6E496|nr:hypothetical protein [Pantoea eucrina]MDJ0023617.1 hypothetical protein [Pantoea eucrina]MDU3783970.1 hypothetical protein [Serratia marcescens]MDU3817813.1 hypothetical protein [Pantoea sp.]